MGVPDSFTNPKLSELLTDDSASGDEIQDFEDFVEHNRMIKAAPVEADMASSIPDIIPLLPIQAIPAFYNSENEESESGNESDNASIIILDDEAYDHEVHILPNPVIWIIDSDEE